MASAGTAYVQIRGDLSNLNKQLVANLAPQRLKKFGLLAGAGLAAGFGAAAVGKGLFNLGQTFDEQFDKIRVGSGATGKALEGLQDDFKNVLKDTPSDFGTVGTAITDLNKRMGLTGKPLRSFATQLLNLSRITKTDLSENIESVARAFEDWEVPVKEQTKALDGLFRLGQKSGASVSQLAGQVQKFGSPLRILGFSLGEAAATFATFQRAGVNIQTTVPGLKLAIANLSKPTSDLAGRMKELGISATSPEDGLKKVFALLGKDSDLSNIKKRTLAMEIFGRRAGADMAEAIRQGRFEVDDMLKVFGKGDSINKASRDTEDFTESWQRLKNRVFVGLEPVATKFFNAISEGMKGLSEFDFDAFGDKFSKVFDDTGLGELDLGLGDLDLGLGDTFAGTEQDISKIKNALTALSEAFLTVFGPSVKEAIAGFSQALEGSLQVVAGALKVLAGILTLDFAKAWDGVKQIFAGGPKVAIGAMRLAFSPLTGVVKAAAGGITKPFKAAWDAVKAAFTGGVRGALGAVRGMGGTLGDIASKAGGALRGPFRAAWSAVRDAFSTGVGAALRVLRSMGSEVGGIAGRIGRAIVRGISRPLQGLGGLFRDVRSVAEGSFNGIKSAIQFVIDKVRALIRLIPKIKFPDINPFARGGTVRDSLALVGEEGPELAKTPGGKMALLGQAGPELGELPIGTRVYSHPETKRRLPSLSQKVIQRLVPAAMREPVPLVQRVVQEALGTDSGRESPRPLLSRALGALSRPQFAKGGVVKKDKEALAAGVKTVGASQFGGPRDPATGHVGKYGELRGTDSYAELNMGKALGGLPAKHPLRITYKGRSLIARKRDIGLGGGHVKGRPRAIDLWYETARKLRFPFGTDLVRTGPAKKQTPQGRKQEQVTKLARGGLVRAAQKMGIPAFARGGLVKPWDWEEEDEREPGTGGPIRKPGFSVPVRRPRRRKRPKVERIRSRRPERQPEFGRSRERVRAEAPRRKPKVEHVPSRDPDRKQHFGPSRKRVKAEEPERRRAKRRKKSFFGKAAPFQKEDDGGLFDFKNPLHEAGKVVRKIASGKGVQVGPVRLFDKRNQPEWYKRAQEIPAFQLATALGPEGATRQGVGALKRLTRAERVQGLRAGQPVLYRGEGGGRFAGKNVYGDVGQYFTLQHGYASHFGEVEKYALAPGSRLKVFDVAGRGTMLSENTAYGRAVVKSQGEFSQAAKNKYAAQLKEQGFSGLHVKNVREGIPNPGDLVDEIIVWSKPPRKGAKRAKKSGGPKRPVTGRAATTLQPAARYLASTMRKQFGLSISPQGGVREGDTDSFHGVGKAVDLVGSRMREGAEWVKSSGLYKTLLEGIHNPNLSTDSGKMVPAGFWGAQTWEEHKDHVHLAASSISEAVKRGLDGKGGPKGKGVKAKEIAKGTLSLGQMVTVAKRVGFPDPALAAAVGYAESRGKVGAVGDGGDSLGLWQINTPAHPTYDHKKLQSDGFYNARAALAISKKGKSWQPWTQFRTGAYKQFLHGRAKALPKGTTKGGAPSGSSYAEYLTMRLTEAEGTKSDKKDDIRWINRALRYYRGVYRRNKRAGNFARANEALGEVNRLKEERAGKREAEEEPALLEPGSKIGTGGQAFSLEGMQRIIEGLELRKAQATLTVPADTDDSFGALAASLKDDITVAEEMEKVRAGINTLVNGFWVPSPLKGTLFEPSKAQSKALSKTKNQTERIGLLNRFIEERDRGTWIVGTVKQKIEAATDLGTARDELRSLRKEATPEAGAVEEPITADTGPSAKAEIKAFLASVGDLLKQYGSNIKPVFPSFAGGGIIPGPKGKPIQVTAHGEEVYFDPRTGNFNIVVKQTKDDDSKDKPQVIQQNTITYAAPEPEPHSLTRSLLHELQAAV